jgi:enamine deaminase RidA (YjgF/YER057c/UK114 family)
MPVELIRQPDGLGSPLGRYSHISVAAGAEIVTVAGQVGITQDGELAGDGGLTAQVWQVFRNLSIALKSQGMELGDVFKLTTYLVGADNIPEFMAARTAAYGEFYPDGKYPPNTLLVVARLVEERFTVEIEAFAIRATRRTGRSAGLRDAGIKVNGSRSASSSGDGAGS